MILTWMLKKLIRGYGLDFTALGRVQWPTVMNTLMNRRVSCKLGISGTSKLLSVFQKDSASWTLLIIYQFYDVDWTITFGMMS
jgi:hypothetical protein